jgi:hypothetical protein
MWKEITFSITVQSHPATARNKHLLRSDDEFYTEVWQDTNGHGTEKQTEFNSDSNRTIRACHMPWDMP